MGVLTELLTDWIVQSPSTFYPVAALVGIALFLLLLLLRLPQRTASTILKVFRVTGSKSLSAARSVVENAATLTNLPEGEAEQLQKVESENEEMMREQGRFKQRQEPEHAHHPSPDEPATGGSQASETHQSQAPQVTDEPPAKPHLAQCKTCGGRVAQSAPTCPHCGQQFPALQMKCPRCASLDVILEKKGVSITKGAIGVWLIGPLGAAAAEIDKNKLNPRCNACGYPELTAEGEQRENEAATMGCAGIILAFIGLALMGAAEEAPGRTNGGAILAGLLLTLPGLGLLIYSAIVSTQASQKR